MCFTEHTLKRIENEALLRSDATLMCERALSRAQLGRQHCFSKQIKQIYKKKFTT